VHFHPAFPAESVRIDPLHSFNRATELASRVAALIPSETGNDPFKIFGQSVWIPCRTPWSGRPSARSSSPI